MADSAEFERWRRRWLDFQAAAEMPRRPAQSPAEPSAGVSAPSVPPEPQGGSEAVDPYTHLTDNERHHLAVHARAIADMYGSERFNSAAPRYARRWREIADGLHTDQGVTDG